MFQEQLSWRECLARPELTLTIPLQSPFRYGATTSNPNQYADWVRALRGRVSGVYWYGWQYGCRVVWWSISEVISRVSSTSA